MRQPHVFIVFAFSILLIEIVYNLPFVNRTILQMICIFKKTFVKSALVLREIMQKNVKSA